MENFIKKKYDDEKVKTLIHGAVILPVICSSAPVFG